MGVDEQAEREAEACDRLEGWKNHIELMDPLIRIVEGREYGKQKLSRDDRILSSEFVDSIQVIEDDGD